jgi:hypothetical protein
MTDIPVRKFLLESFYTIGPLLNHNEIKQQVLDSLDHAQTDTLVMHDSYYNDSVNKLDWSQAQDFSRPWVKLLKPHIEDYLNKLAVALGYQSSIIDEFWFQQYVNGDMHGWHTHGSNFTGVYYLELDNNSPKTEIIEPSKQNKKIVLDVKEGDIVMFPSYTIHRAPVINNDIRKTIVSFNFILDLIDPRTLNDINQL